jgi:hypothetical protein
MRPAPLVVPSAQYLNDTHPPTIAWAWLAQCKRDHLSALLWFLVGLLHLKQGSDLGDVGLSGLVGQQAIVPDAVEAVHCPAGDCKAICREVAGRGSGFGEYP